MKTIINTEYVGILTERFICDYFGISFSSKRSYTSDSVSDLRDCIYQVLSKMDIQCVKHIGGLNNSVDFLMPNHRKLSVITNISPRMMVCPQNIGQLSFGRVKDVFGISIDVFKEYVVNNLSTFLTLQIQNLFTCDETIVFSYYTGVGYFITKTYHLPKMDNENLTLSRYASEWRERTTIYSNGISIAECQVHQARKTIKFRFKNLVKTRIDGIYVKEYCLNQRFLFKVERMMTELDHNQCLGYSKKNTRCKRVGNRGGYCFQYSVLSFKH